MRAALRQSDKQIQNVGALLAGMLFAGGLALGGMTDPANIQHFLNVASGWSPQLLAVIVGAITVYAAGYWLIAKRLKHPVAALAFAIPTRRDIDRRLVIGGAIFGVGWAIAGWCPGPALASLGVSPSRAGIFVLAMLVGSYGTKWIDHRLKRTA